MTNIEELHAEIKKLRKDMQRDRRLLVRGTEAAEMLGMHPVSFYKNPPIPPTYVPGETNPRYSVRLIKQLIEQWTKEQTA